MRTLRIANQKDLEKLHSDASAYKALLVIIPPNFQPQELDFAVMFHEKLEYLDFDIYNNFGSDTSCPILDTWLVALRRSFVQSHVLSFLNLYSYFTMRGPCIHLQKSLAQLPLAQPLGQGLRRLRLAYLVLPRKLCGLLGRTLPLLKQLERVDIFQCIYQASDGFLLSALTNVAHYSLRLSRCSHPQAFLDFDLKERLPQRNNKQSRLGLSFSGNTTLGNCVSRAIISAGGEST